ncbi:MAG: class I SAM-dependent methyltransferase [Actinobacteria bacterium]|nr:class I SAM-dependent methyltransferase [Actinomycetota bacterium]
MTSSQRLKRLARQGKQRTRKLVRRNRRRLRRFRARHFSATPQAPEQPTARVRTRRRADLEPVVETADDLDYVGYWEDRYSSGGTSGVGSYGKQGAYKAAVVNAFIEANEVGDVMEFGCGDSAQLSEYHLGEYLGLDVSAAAIEKCRERFGDDPRKHFQLYRPGDGATLPQADMTMTLEVLMHITVEQDYVRTVADLLGSARRYVVIFNPLWPLLDYRRGSTERHHDILAELERYREEFHISEPLFSPRMNRKRRERGRIGMFASDFVFLARRSTTDGITLPPIDPNEWSQAYDQAHTPQAAPSASA